MMWTLAMSGSRRFQRAGRGTEMPERVAPEAGPTSPRRVCGLRHGWAGLGSARCRRCAAGRIELGSHRRLGGSGARCLPAPGVGRPDRLAALVPLVPFALRAIACEGVPLRIRARRARLQIDLPAAVLHHPARLASRGDHVVGGRGRAGLLPCSTVRVTCRELTADGRPPCRAPRVSLHFAVRAGPG